MGEEGGRRASKTIIRWSDTPILNVSVFDMCKPEDRTKSRVWPLSCVGPDTDCKRLKASIV